MTTDHDTSAASVAPPLRVVLGAGGAVLVGSLFLPWGDGRSGWELLTTADVFFLIAGLVALAAAATGGRIGVFRPDVSLNGAADVLSLVAIALTASLAIFDFPAEAGREAGVFVALAASIAIAAAAGDYRVVRGAPLFARLD